MFYKTLQPIFNRLSVKVVHCTEGSTFYDPTLQYGVDFNILWYCFYWSNWLYIIICQWSKTLWQILSHISQKSNFCLLFCTQVYSLHVTPSFIFKLFRFPKIIMNHLKKSCLWGINKGVTVRIPPEANLLIDVNPCNPLWFLLTRITNTIWRS